MAKRDPRMREDGWTALLGSDSSVSPSLIGADRAAFAGNVMFRGGFPATRDGLDQLPLVYPTTEIAEWVEENILQGAAIYTPRYGSAFVVASIGGRIFTIDPMGWAVREITPTLVTTTAAAFTAPAVGGQVAVTLTDGSRVYAGYPITINGFIYNVVSTANPTITVKNVTAPAGNVAAGSAAIILDVNSPINGRAWLKQAESFLIIQDGQARALIFDGAALFRSSPTKQQVPTGTVMAYGIGRLWVAVNKNEFVASDLVRGSSGTVQYGNVDAILYFKENTLIAGGGAFTVPIQSGEITAMEFMPVLDTSTGNGPLIVFTERGAFSVNVPLLRTDWPLVTSPVQTVVLTGNGAVSAYATVATTNSDIFFRSKDGLRSFVLAIREFQNSWGNTPVSSELSRVLDKDDEVLIRYSSAIQFQNRLWFTVSPKPLPEKEQGAYHDGMATLDFHPISNMRQKSPPTYDGVHAGIKPTLLFKGVIDGRERAFVWALNEDNHNELWEMSVKEPFDNGDRRIKNFLETKSYPFQNPLELKRLEGVEIYVKEVMGRVDFTLFYKPDDYPCWIEWGRQQVVCANWRDCPEPDALCTTPVVYRPGYKTRLSFGQPPRVDHDVDDKPAQYGYEFQFRLEWEGRCVIRKFVAKAFIPDEEPSKRVK